MEKKKYTQAEKIKYWSLKVAKAQYLYEKFQKNLERVMSPDYQDWDDELSKQLKAKKKRA